MTKHTDEIVAEQIADAECVQLGPSWNGAFATICKLGNLTIEGMLSNEEHDNLAADWKKSRPWIFLDKRHQIKSDSISLVFTNGRSPEVFIDGCRWTDRLIDKASLIDPLEKNLCQPR